MTDAERTPEQTSADSQEQPEQASGLLSKLMDKAKDVAGAVADKAKDVVEAVSERAPAVVEKVQSLVTSDEPSAEAQADARAEQENDVVAGDVQAETAEPVAAGETIGDKVAAVAANVGDTVGDAVASVRTTVARVYDRVTGDAAPSDDTAGKGASYEPAVEGAKGGRPRRFKDVTPGMQLEGKVTSIALYGVFVDVGVGRDGLVHISEMSDKRIDSPTDVVEIGTPVKVWVKSVDADARRISLTMRDPNRPKPDRQERRQPRKPEVNREKLASLKPGDNIEGVISSVAPFGAFVDIGAGKDGLVHISELAEGRVEKPEDAVTIGERYTFKVLEVDPEGTRISLSLRRAQRSQRMQQLEPGTQLDGTISGLAPFGAFVDIGVGRDGLVHVSELSSERVNKVEDVVAVGDKVQVKVIEVDPNSKRISLTMRVEEPLPNERPKPAPRAGGFSDGPSFGGASGGFGGGASGGFGGGASGGFGGGASGGFGGGAGERGAGRPGESRGGTGGRGERRDRGDRAGGFGGGDDRPGAAPRRGNDRDRGRGGDAGRAGGGAGRDRPRRDGQMSDAPQEVYTFEDPEEETFTGDASLEDLLSKFNSGKDRNKRTREQTDDDAQRSEAIRRTLAMRDEE